LGYVWGGGGFAVDVSDWDEGSGRNKVAAAGTTGGAQAVNSGSEKPQPISVLAAVIQQSGDYLVCQRPSEKRHGGLWEFPGGKLEPGETLAEAASRELREELGVTVRAIGPSIFAVADPGSPFVIEFVPVEIEGIPTCLEHQALSWVPLEKLSGFALAPSDRAFVEYLHRRSQGQTRPT
jgi:8-oxo-dGTP diphosphatase